MIRLTRAFVVGGVVLAAAACADAPTPPGADVRAPVTISATLTPTQQAIVAGMSVEVSGPGITTPIIATLAVSGATVNGTVSVPVGASRTFTVRAYDAQGTETYNGSATASVVAGTNPPLAVRMTALEGSVPIDVTIGTYGVTLTPPTASIAIGAELTLTANATANGTTAPGPLTWGVLNPALVTITVASDGRSAVVRGRVAGSTRVVASYEGVAAASTITITGATNQAPVVFINGPYTGTVGTAINFNPSGTGDLDGAITSWHWSFGDGTTSTVQNAIKTYQAAGTYTVTLTVTDDDGATASKSTTATVAAPVNLPPTVTMGGPNVVTVGAPATFSASGSDADGTVVGYRWFLSNELNPIATVAGSLTYTFNAAGTYTVSVVAVDDDGDASQASSRSVTVNPAPANKPPTVAIHGFNIVTVGVPASFTATSTDDDGTVVEYRWTFTDVPGTTSTSTGAITHTFATAGSYTASVVAVDDDGAQSQPASRLITVNPTVTNQPPIVNINGPYSGLVNTSIQFTSNGTGDPDGTIVQYDWSFGDGPNSFSGLAFPTHTYTAPGTYTVTLTVRDNGGATTTRTTTATISTPPPNQPPTVTMQSQFIGRVGVPLTLTASGSDVDGTVQSYVWVLSSEPGTITTATGSLTRTFNAVGTYQVSVAAFDNRGAISASKSAIITVQP